MPTPIKIRTSKYTSQGKVDVDGHIWSVVMPGAGTEMRFSQATRECKAAEARIRLLEKKIDNGTITEAELDTYEENSKKYQENERVIYGIFLSIFKDDTADNADVKKWMNDTPTAIIMLAFEDVKTQANEESDGSESTPASA